MAAIQFHEIIGNQSYFLTQNHKDFDNNFQLNE